MKQSFLVYLCLEQHNGLTSQLWCEQHVLPTDPLQPLPGLLPVGVGCYRSAQHFLPALPHMLPCAAGWGHQAGVGCSGGGLVEPDVKVVSCGTEVTIVLISRPNFIGSIHVSKASLWRSTLLVDPGDGLLPELLPANHRAVSNDLWNRPRYDYIFGVTEVATSLWVFILSCTFSLDRKSIGSCHGDCGCLLHPNVCSPHHSLKRRGTSGEEMVSWM